MRWQCGLGMPLRFMDPFGGEPWGETVPEVERRVRALTAGSLRAAQSHIELAARLLREAKRVREIGILRWRLTAFAEQLSGILGVPAKQLEPRIVGR